MAEPLSLYVHIPFCTAKCGYCDFNSYAGHEHLIRLYSEALLREAELWRELTAGREIETIFFGGGTPSLEPLHEIERIMAGLRSAFTITAPAEVTLEANPGSVDEAYLRGLRDLGVNRLSIGVQSFHDDELRALDRLHNADDARAAFHAARAAGFDNINLDLIFGLPEQPIERWQESAEQALALAPEHLSLYALTIEEGTPLARDVARGRTPWPDPDSQVDQYEWTRDRLASAGYERYEISNWSRPGRRCRHNLTYWQCREYLGLGAGAHSYVDGVRFANARLPGRYIALVDEASPTGCAEPASLPHVASSEAIDRELAMTDTMILGLRLSDGVSLEGFRGRFGVDALDVYGERLEESREQGLLEVAGDCMRLTERGQFLANEVLARILPD